MTLHAHLDPLGGMAGDMFLAALLQAWPEHLDGVVATIRRAGVPEPVRVRVAPHRDHALSGSRFVVEATEQAPRPAGTYRVVRDRILSSDLPRPVRARALAVFALLAEAEGVVHGVPPEDVTFHEVAGWDSVADIVGAAHLLETLPINSWSVAALPIGGGRVATSHGPLPVPAPATTELLRGFEMVDDGIMGERVTPTGAAILRHLQPSAGLAGRTWKIRAAGTGFGSRQLDGVSNVLRLLVYERNAVERLHETVACITFEVDDQTPEDLAIGLERLRAKSGVLDVMQTAALGKKGRMMISVQVLCGRSALEETVDACFAETTTIGLRWLLVQRAVLARSDTDDGKVKLVARPGGYTAKMDVGAVKDLPGGSAARTETRRSAESQALGKAPRDNS